MVVFNKRRMLCVLLFTISTPFLYQWAVSATADSIVSPERRLIQDYHQEWLDQPSSNGIQIQSYTCLSNTTPCLLVTPDSNSRPAKRGQRLREQLAEKNYPLAKYGDIKGTILLLHGRNGRKEDLLAVAERFCAAAFRCILPDLPAHGDSTQLTTSFGLSDFDQSFAITVLEEMAGEHHFENSPAYLWGMSMGGAFTSAALKHSPDHWSAAMIVCSFDSLPNVIEDKATSILPWGGHTFAQSVISQIKSSHSIDCHKIQPAQWLQKARIPLFFAHGTDDPLISMQRGRSLYQHASSSSKKWVTVDGANHSNILVTPMPLFAEMAAWFLDHSPPESSLSHRPTLDL